MRTARHYVRAARHHIFPAASCGAPGASFSRQWQYRCTPLCGVLNQRLSGATQFLLLSRRSARAVHRRQVGPPASRHTESRRFQVVCSATPLDRAYHWTSPVSVIVMFRSSATTPAAPLELTVWHGRTLTASRGWRTGPPGPRFTLHSLRRPDRFAAVTRRSLATAFPPQVRGPPSRPRFASRATVLKRLAARTPQPRRNSHPRTACEPGLLGGLSALRVGPTGI